MQITESPSKAFQSLHVDHFGPIVASHTNTKYILVVIDAFSRFTWFFGCKTAGTRESVKHLSYLFDIFGNPEHLTSDRGSVFTANDFRQFLRRRDIVHHLIAVAAPWANDLAERRFLKTSLKKLLEDPWDWDAKLGTVQYICNNTYYSSIKNTPSKVYLGYEQRNHNDRHLVDFLRNATEAVVDVEASRDQARHIALLATKEIKDYNKAYYDARHLKPSVYSAGDLVAI